MRLLGDHPRLSGELREVRQSAHSLERRNLRCEHRAAGTSTAPTKILDLRLTSPNALGLLSITAMNGHDRSLKDKDPRNRFADTFAAACDQGVFSLQP